MRTYQRQHKGRDRARERQRGVALVPTMLVVSGLAIFLMALMTTVLTGKRTVNHQSDDFKLSSAVESVAVLTAEELWSGYLLSQGGAPRDIFTFRQYMDVLGIENDPDFDPENPTAPPSAGAGTDLLSIVDLPLVTGAGTQFDHVRIDALRMVRRDIGDSTQLFLTASASTNRGAGIVNPVLNRAVQQVYTVEPDDFTGFDYAMLANNVNCIFCHTKVDSVERYFNTDASLFGTFDRIKVGTLESLMVRHNFDGNSAVINDFDTDSVIAGTLYVRGSATTQDGDPITNWGAQSFLGYAFDGNGHVIQDAWGEMSDGGLTPAGTPPDRLENLYLDYPSAYADMVDGNLPLQFPSAIPDDGGRDPTTGLPDASAYGNRIVDEVEWNTLADDALGSITAGILNLTDPGDSIGTLAEYAAAVFTGNVDSLAQEVDGNVILTGTPTDPIWIDGVVAIDGDLIINGYVKGEGSLVVRGNVYIPTDLQYLDGTDENGHRTFGVASDGTSNAFGLSAGGNILIGDYIRPGTLQPDGTWSVPPKYAVISGEPSSGDPAREDAWNFSLAEMSLFNRGEWAKTQPFLPGPGETNLPDPNPSTPRNEAWTVPNAGYVDDYVARYYGFGDGDTIPIYNRGNIYYDAGTGTWHGDVEVPTSWDPSKLTYVEPTNPSDPHLFNADGTPKAVVQTLNPTNAWIDDTLYKISIEYFQDLAVVGEPMRIDGLLYTNNSIFTLVSRIDPQRGQIVLNGSLVAADLGMLAPGYPDAGGGLSSNHSPISTFAIGLQLNYDKRVKGMLNVKNPFQVRLKRTLWHPTRNVL